MQKRIRAAAAIHLAWCGLTWGEPNLSGTYEHRQGPEIIRLTFKTGNLFEYTELEQGRITIKAYGKFALGKDSILIREAAGYDYNHWKCQGEDCARREKMVRGERLFAKEFHSMLPDHGFAVAKWDKQGFSIHRPDGKVVALERRVETPLEGTYRTHLDYPCAAPKAGICSSYALTLTFKPSGEYKLAHFMNDSVTDRTAGKYFRMEDSLHFSEIVQEGLPDTAAKAPGKDYGTKVVEWSNDGYSIRGGLDNVIRFRKVQAVGKGKKSP